MSVIRWNNNSLFPSINSMLDSLFTNNTNFFSEVEKGTIVPAVNVVESDESFSLELAAPGKSKKDFNVEIDNGVLTISSENEESTETSEKNYTKKEYSFQSFKRSFSLPENIDAENINAKYEDGILYIVVPKVKPVNKEVKSISVG